MFPQDLCTVRYGNERTTTLPLEVFSQRKFVADFIQLKLTFILKRDSSLFEPPFGRLRGNVRTSSITRWKAHVRLPIRHNWTFFASSYCWDVTGGNLWTWACGTDGWTDGRADGRTDGRDGRTQNYDSQDWASIAASHGKNRAPTSCRPGRILWLPTVSFEHCTKVAEEIDLEMCSYGQLSEVQMLHDLDLDLGWGQGHINI